MTPHFILYVRDQKASVAFYRSVFLREPRLDVPGMTEFDLEGAVLGIMPEAGIRHLLGPTLPKASAGLRAELYLLVDDPAAFHRRALEAGARELSPLAARDWGHVVAYSLDADGHVVAFARG
ncbi:MAG: VOC family protein [Myxococcales bacterium]|nr:VOC family protein [Myxococcales bacterium]